MHQSQFTIHLIGQLPVTPIEVEVYVYLFAIRSYHDVRIDTCATLSTEYRREKLAVQNARLTGSAGCPRRKRLLHTGSLNFRPPVCRSKSAPRLGSIDEEQEASENGESVCYRAEPDNIGKMSLDPSADVVSCNFQLEQGARLDSFAIYLGEEQRHERMNTLEFDSISDESGYHEEKLPRGRSEESCYSDGELVMLEEDYDDSEEQITPL
ncbi:hypothetical protein RB195_024449 [Necator americanus]|uniref:PID domain-containing protein n=1 Tax=Necator americanus TaxID=51031 RepID=A0ABR1EQI2_NECAM